MSLALDIILVITIAGAIINGLRKGLIRSAIDFAGCILALILAFNLSVSFGQYIGSTYIAPPVKKSISAELVKTVQDQQNNQDIKVPDISKILNDSPDYIKKMMESAGISTQKVIDEVGAPSATTTLDEYVGKFVDGIINPVADTIGRLIAFVIIYFAVIILVKILSFALGFLTKLPVIKQFDKAGGVIFGIINGVFIVFVLCAALNAVLPIIQNDSKGALNDKAIENTSAFKIFYNINPIKINK